MVVVVVEVVVVMMVVAHYCSVRSDARCDRMAERNELAICEESIECASACTHTHLLEATVFRKCWLREAAHAVSSSSFLFWAWAHSGTRARRGSENLFRLAEKTRFP